MPKFVSRQELYRLLQRELPEELYPDGPASAFYSTADMDSVADVAATAYGNMERIYLNQWPQSADERIDDWVLKVFGYKFDESVTLDEKRSRVIAKLRHQPTIRLWEVLTIVASYVPEGTYVQVAEYSCGAASGWHLGESYLGYSTFLGFDHIFDKLNVDSSKWCDIVSDGWRLGFSRLEEGTSLSEFEHKELFDIQAEAFGYQIRVFDYAVTGDSYTRMIQEVKAAEPARSFFNIAQNLDLTDYHLVVDVSNVGEFDNITCITRDVTQTTGYKGKRTD
jgi:hypothetical protein